MLGQMGANNRNDCALAVVRQESMQP
jgi:hypothetical protein